MTMASRDIANMHLFLDLKKKFPDLPDETLRRYVPLYAENQEKCINFLQKESQNHYHPSQPFSDYRLPESKVNSSINDYAKHFVGSPNDCLFPSGFVQQLEMPALNKHLPPASGRSKSHAGVIGVPGKTLSTNLPSKPYTAPVITSSDKPFTALYKQNPISSHSTMCQVPNDRSNQMMFSTTKQFIIEPPVTHESKEYIPISGEPDDLRKSAVKLTITPSFPFQQQQVNVVSNPVCTTTSTSRPGRHTTSLSFQLQPESSSDFPLEISTIPTSIGSPSNFKDFGSHVQVSVGAQGATFTALRLQHPVFSQTQNASSVAGAEGGSDEKRMPSSQAQNSSLYLFPNTRFQPSLGTKEIGQSNNFLPNSANSQIRTFQTYESSTDYILAVKNQQIAQLDSLFRELEKEKAICTELKAEVNKLEQDITRSVNESSFPYAEELRELRKEIKNLRVECDCLLREVDSSDQIAFGVSDEKIFGEMFPGPKGNGTPSSAKDVPKTNVKDQAEARPDDEENDEHNSWKCGKCTFENHPALDKCEVCELPKNSEYLKCNSGYSPSTCVRFISSAKDQPRRAVGSVQISVTRRVPASSKSVKFQLTHRLPR